MNELDKLYEERDSIQRAIDDFEDDEDYCAEMYEELDYIQSEIDDIEEELKNK
jgi:hypothetical protein